MASVAALALVALLAGCGGDTARVDAVEVRAPWARTTPAGATNGVVYFEVVSPTDDAVVGVTVPATIATTAEVHETTGAAGGAGHAGHGGGGDGASGPGSGAMGMAPLAEVPLPAQEAVAFAPGGRHVMLVDLAAPLVRGSSFELTVVLRSGVALSVDVPVLDNAPSS